MPAIPTSAPRVERKFAGLTIQAPSVYSAGYVLTAPDAAWVNATLASTIGNYFGGDIRRALTALDTERAAQLKAKTYTGPMDDTGKKPAPATFADLDWDAQAEFDAKFAAYVLGESNRGGGGSEPSNPVERLVRLMASEAVKALIVRKGQSVQTWMRTKEKDADGNEVSSFTRLVGQYIERNGDALTASAEAQLAALPSDDDDIEVEAQAAA